MNELDFERRIQWLLTKYRDRIEQLSEFLADGRATSFEEYRHNAGQIKALKGAIDDIRILLRNDDDDD